MSGRRSTRSRVRRFVLGAVATLAPAACDIPESPLEPGARQLLVHAVLDAGSTTQLLNLSWSDGTPFVTAFGASITLIYPDGHAIGAFGDRGPRETYSLNTEAIRDRIVPGDEYELFVRVGSIEVRGTTTVPIAPLPSVQERTLSRSRDTLRLSWPRATGAKAYYVTIQSATVNGVETAFYTSFADTSVSIAGTLRTFENVAVFGADEIALVIVSAVDDNFYTYYHAAVDPFAGAPPSRLTGGLGVFGSIVPVVRLRLQVSP